MVKQALPYVRLVGESWPLPLERSWFEYSALVEQARHAPGLTPEVFHFDRAQAMIVMEYLSPHVIMRKGLIRGVEYPRFAADIAEFLAATLFNTSVLAGTAAEHKARVALFAPNVALWKITEDLVFTDPYREAPLNRWTRPYLDAQKRAFEKDSALKIAAQERKYQFMTGAQALIHGDLHTGSIMLTREDTRVIDPEFAFIGPIGFDVGAVIGNLLLAFFAQEGHEVAPGARNAYRDWILRQAEDVWSGFNDRFLELWRAARSGDAYPVDLFASVEGRLTMDKERGRFMRGLFEDTLAFAGAKMIRRILGLAHVEDLEAIADPERRARCEAGGCGSRASCWSTRKASPASAMSSTRRGRSATPETLRTDAAAPRDAGAHPVTHPKARASIRGRWPSCQDKRRPGLSLRCPASPPATPAASR